MDIIKEAATALKQIDEQGIDVQSGWYDENKELPQVRLWYIGGSETDHSDDYEESESELIQVSHFSEIDEIETIQLITKLMKSYGFKYEERNSDTFETDKNIYVKSARFELDKEREE